MDKRTRTQHAIEEITLATCAELDRYGIALTQQETQLLESKIQEFLAQCGKLSEIVEPAES